MKTISLVFFLFVISVSTLAQVPRDTITLSEILLKTATQRPLPDPKTESSPFQELIIEGKTIINDSGISFDNVIGDLDFIPPHEMNLSLNRDSINYFVIDKTIRFINCQFPNDVIISKFRFRKNLIFEECRFDEHLIIRDLYAQKIEFIGTNHAVFIIDSVQTDHLKMDGSEVEYVTEIRNSTFNDELGISFQSPSFFFINNTINVPQPKITLKHEDLFYKGAPTWNFVDVFNCKSVSIEKNNLNGHGSLDIFSFDFSDAESISVLNNKVKGIFQLKGKATYLTMFGNSFLKIDFHAFSFPESKVSIEWNNVNNFSLCNAYWAGSPERILETSEYADFYDQMNASDSTDSGLPQIYFGKTPKELRAKWFFDQLSADYYRIYQSYKTQGRVEDANAIYYEMKELHRSRAKILFKEKPSTTNFLKWQLSELLKFYTDHGTEPVKAILISFYIILVFGIFYFFFPSEWDTKSKNQLVTDFKTFVKKNEHGYFKPFFILLKGAAISLINALTLSLNAFVTLGFGTIPTTGLARYVCVIQGFIGWFLLSIFTVALINQVLF